MELRGEVSARNGLASHIVLIPIHAVIVLHRAEHHLRVAGEITVDRDAVRRFAKVYPVRHNVEGTVTFLEE